MLRTFDTHSVRFEKELSDKLWDFSPVAGEHAGKEYKLMVPGCWESHMDLINYRGTGVYTNTFEAEGNIRLVFKGASHTANVYVDGEFAGTHYNAFTAFDVIVKDLAPGTHTLKVEIDNSFSEDSVLHKENDYMTYGGLNRGVALEKLGDVYIKGIRFNPTMKDGVWNASVAVTVANISDKELAPSLAFELNGNTYTVGGKVLAGQETAIIEENFVFEGVEPWMMETPNLYLMNMMLSVDGEVVDDLIERVGFREVTLDGKFILVNGKKIRIKGFNRHEDHAHFGCSLPYAALVYDMHLIKDMGANSIRTSHYPNDELFLDLCDECGILVWEEHHARGFDEDYMRLPNFDKQCCDCIEEMIEQHYNHPSIYIWGILNECASHTEFGASCYKRQFELIESLDTSRPRTFASNKHYKDLAFEYPNVISNNMYPEWYFDIDVAEMLQKHLDYLDEVLHGEVKPFMVSEIGCGGIYGSHSRTHDKWTEEGQVDIIKKQVAPILANKDCLGVYIWQFCDVRVTPEWSMKRPRTYNNKGMVDEYRHEKLAYFAVKEMFEGYSNYID
ncbi:MAG: glycoside hydrolase family 2 TIM barrel-domain containing protein [Lachnospiraceae bacterium]